MKKLAIVLGAAFCLALALAGVRAAETVKSGPQVGEEVPGPFEPLNLNGPNAGTKCCQYCKNGSNPVAVIFTRHVSPPVVDLIKKLDAATAANKSAKMGSYVVVLNQEDKVAEKLKELATHEKIEHTILTVDDPPGPRDYEINKTADVTVLLYTNHKVKANYAFGKGAMTEKDVEQIVGDLPKILLPAK